MSKASMFSLSEQDAESDFHKLMKICSSYGLNQEETNQLIDQLKKGALFSPEHSFNDSLNQSLNELTFSQKLQDEEYSFKHQKISEDNRKQPIRQPEHMNIQDQSINHQTYSKQTEREQMIPISVFQQLVDKFAIQKGQLSGLQQENKYLRISLEQKEKNIQDLMHLKKQDSEIIIGLKDIISNLTLTLKERQNSFQVMQERTARLMEDRVKQLSDKRSMTETCSQQEMEHANESIRGSNTTLKQINREQPSKQDKPEISYKEIKKNRNGNRIDVKKYKEMIENLRNNY